MQANNLIKEINSVINEDAYSRYTAKQLYQKLGKDGFLNYLEDISQKIVRRNNLEYLKDMELVDTTDSVKVIGLMFTKENNDIWTETLFVDYNLTTNRLYAMVGASGKDDIFVTEAYMLSRSDVDIYSKLTEKILSACKDKKLNSTRNKIINRAKKSSESK
jgi:hypothetical protein